MTRYKNLADIERGFRVLKRATSRSHPYSTACLIASAPALICFLALVLYLRCACASKRAAAQGARRRRAEMLRRIQKHRATIGGAYLHRHQQDHPRSNLICSQ